MARRVCIHCGSSYPENIKFCPEDGRPTKLESGEDSDTPQSLKNLRNPKDKDTNSPLFGRQSTNLVIESSGGGDLRVGKTIDRYQLIERIGSGGMGVVYKAEHQRLGNQVALKLLHPELVRVPQVVDRFFREAKATSTLIHRHIVRALDFGRTEDNDCFLVMELLTGRSLQEVLKEEKRLSVIRTIEIALQTAEALHVAHENGVIHRDLKPGNIQLTQHQDDSDYVKVLDFGIAKIIDEGGNELTRTGMILGSPAYMSPEQASGKAVDHRADIYGLGIITYEMLAGSTPFGGKSPPQMMLDQVHVKPEPLRSIREDVPKPLEKIVLGCLDKDPQKRPASMIELKELLFRWIKSSGTGAFEAWDSDVEEGEEDEQKSDLQEIVNSKTLPFSVEDSSLSGIDEERSVGAEAPTVQAIPSVNTDGSSIDDHTPKRSRLWLWLGLVCGLAGIYMVWFTNLTEWNGHTPITKPARKNARSNSRSTQAIAKTTVDGRASTTPPVAEKKDLGATSDWQDGNVDTPLAFVEKNSDAGPTSQPSEEESSRIVSQIPTTDPEKEKPEVVILSIPEGASVSDGQRRLGSTPLTLSSEKTLQLTLVHRGCRTVRLIVSKNTRGILNAELIPIIKKKRRVRRRSKPRHRSRHRYRRIHSISKLNKLYRRRRISRASYRRRIRRLYRQRKHRLAVIRRMYKRRRLKRAKYRRYARAIIRYYR